MSQDEGPAKPHQTSSSATSMTKETEVILLCQSCLPSSISKVRILSISEGDETSHSSSSHSAPWTVEIPMEKTWKSATPLIRVVCTYCWVKSEQKTKPKHSLKSMWRSFWRYVKKQVRSPSVFVMQGTFSINLQMHRETMVRFEVHLQGFLAEAVDGCPAMLSPLSLWVSK